jgi:hypothetical protein
MIAQLINSVFQTMPVKFSQKKNNARKSSVYYFFKTWPESGVSGISRVHIAYVQSKKYAASISYMLNGSRL